jgi:hypothetical protein
MANIIVGQQHAELEGVTYGQQVGRGGYQKRRWKVTNSTDIGTLVSALAASGYSYEVQPQGQITIVEGTLDYDNGGSPTTTVLSTIWERDVHVAEKDVLESNITLVSSLSDSDKRTIRDFIGHDYPMSPALTGNALTVYKLMLNGFKTWTIYQPIIKRTWIAANSYSVAASDTNVGLILTAAQMTSLEGAPGGLLYALPASGTGSRSDIALKVGYLKMPCRVHQQGDGRWQITQEWHYGHWAGDLYSWA